MKIKKITEIIGTRVFTDEGNLFGEIEEANLVENKIDSWRIRVTGGLTSMIGGARGVIIPHKFVKSMGDVIIISKAALPNQIEPELESE